MTTPRDGTQATDDQPMPGARLVEELRLLLDALAERAEPMLNRLAAGEQDEHLPATCGWCPVCAGMAVLRGERPELAVRAAEHAAGLLTVLRTALTDPTAKPNPAGHPNRQHPAGPENPTHQAEHPKPESPKRSAAHPTTENPKRQAGHPTTDGPTGQPGHPKNPRVQHIPVRRRDPGDDGEC